MVTTALVISLALLTTVLLHFVAAIYFRTVIMLRPQDSVPENDLGLASVILTVRGCDPGLRKSLIKLLDQNYQNYEIHVVVDHHQDTAWKVVHEVKSEYDIDGRLNLHEMQQPLESCGLKCSALLQGISQLSDESKYLVLMDSDVVPHPSWLRQLIAPLNHKKIGVVTGNQWFEPEHENFGTIVRSLWYAGAIVPTALYSNPWAGTFAMRIEDVRRAKLPEIWRRSIVDDGPIREAIKPLGLKVYFNPALIMINREQCTFDFTCRYVARTLTWSRMYEPTFINTLIHCLLTVGLLLTAILLSMGLLMFGETTAGLILVSGILTGCFINAISYLVIRNAISITSNLEKSALPNLQIGKLVWLSILSPVANLVYGYGCVAAFLRQKIQWRQITYRIHSKSQVKMLGYQPWQAENQEETESKVSIG